MGKELINPAKRKGNYNYSLEIRTADVVEQQANVEGISRSQLVNRILNTALGIVD